MQIKEVIIVEGKNDTKRLQEVFGTQIYTIETGGSALNKEKIELIKKAHTHRGAIVFTDPDYAGNKIRTELQENIPSIKHAFIMQSDGISKNKKKVGLEHANEKVILDALSSVYTTHINKLNWEITDLYNLKLIGHPNSSELRQFLSHALCLGHTNAKQLLKRLNMFDIEKDKVIEILNQRI